MKHSFTKYVNGLGVVACALYIFSHVLFTQSTLLTTFDAIRLAEPIIVVEGLTISMCFIVLATKIYRMRLGVVCAIATLIAVLVVSAVRAKDFRLFESVLLIITVANIDSQKLIKWVAMALAAGITVVVLASLCGMIWNKDVLPNEYLVFGYGFGHPNTFGALLTCLVVAVLYIGWNHRFWVLPIVMAMLLAIFCKIMLSSNTAAMLILSYCIASALGHLFNEKLTLLFTKRVRVLLTCTLAIFVVASMLYLMAAYDNTNPVHKTLNDILHFRPYFGMEYYRTNGGFTILGRPYLSISAYHQGTTFESLDSGVMYMGGVYGLLPLLCCCGLLAYLVAHLPENRRSFFVWALIMMGIFNLLTEGYPLFVYTNISLLLLSDGLAFRSEFVPRECVRLRPVAASKEDDVIGLHNG